MWAFKLPKTYFFVSTNSALYILLHRFQMKTKKNSPTWQWMFLSVPFLASQDAVEVRYVSEWVSEWVLVKDTSPLIVVVAFVVLVAVVVVVAVALAYCVFFSVVILQNHCFPVVGCAREEGIGQTPPHSLCPSHLSAPTNTSSAIASMSVYCTECKWTNKLHYRQ